jgi:pimeloyl-ACP methyl ester carboxylesterase
MADTEARPAPQEVHATSRDGTRIAAFRSGRGAPLVLVHGTTADHTRWRPVLAALEEGFTVYAMDRRGRGGSGDHPSYAFEREFEDVAAVVDLASREAGVPVDLLGHSWGGVCSAGGALRSRNVRRLVLYEPPLIADESQYPPGFLGSIDSLVAAGCREEALLSFMRDVVRVPPAQLGVLRSLPAWRGRIAAAHTIARECRRSGYPLAPAELARLRMPVLLLEGSESPAFLRQAIGLLAQGIPQARVAVMPGQQHAAMDTGPELFLREVLGFLA